MTTQIGMIPEQLQMAAEPQIHDVEQLIELIPMQNIVTGAYQRNVCARTVAMIVSKFDPAKLGVLVVNHRTDGTYAIIDGQHRLAALRIMGVAQARCIVLEGMTLEEEADYFRFQNENKRALTAFDTFNAGVCAKDVHFVTLKYLLEKYGFRVSRVGHPHCIAAVDALTRITQLFGFSVLEQVLALIAATWPTDATIVRREMLAGMAEFVSRFGHQITIQQFSARMADKHPSEMLYQYQRRTEGHATTRNSFNPTMRFVLCAVITECYNKGLSSKSRQRLNLNWYSETMSQEGVHENR